MKTTITKKQLEAGLAALMKPRGAWEKGVRTYAKELIGSLEVDEIDPAKLEAEMLNGARNWKEASEGGSHLIYDAQIAERLCSPSELKKCKGGKRQPNARETWLECQARALGQAARLVTMIANN